VNESDTEDSLAHLREALRKFARDRDWDQFHTPRNLATALAVEAAELLEHFLWLKDDEVAAFDEAKLEKIGEELADVLLYLIRLSDKLNLDLTCAASQKMNLNAAKYPVALAKGSSKKYTEL
jgi:NTP pyrophosphatase (non-canonical NTP hydrolase)